MSIVSSKNIIKHDTEFRNQLVLQDLSLIKFQNLIKNSSNYIMNKNMIKDYERNILKNNLNNGLYNKRTEPWNINDFDEKFDANEYWNNFLDSL